ncbi:hypothetical protein SLA2020_440920 [Shorea laevis]
MSTAHRHPAASSRPAEASMWPLSVASSSNEQSSKPHKGWAMPQPTTSNTSKAMYSGSTWATTAKAMHSHSTWATATNPSCYTDPSPSNPPSLVNMVGLHHPQLQPFSAQDIPWSCLGMVVSKDARHIQAATMTPMSRS